VSPSARSSRRASTSAQKRRWSAHHPDEEIIYILEGSFEYQIEGQPPKTFNAGDALTVPTGAIHAVRNVGTGQRGGLANYVEKGKPILTLVE
jgi:quercetin dioxygenase-like cupin family protein